MAPKIIFIVVYSILSKNTEEHCWEYVALNTASKNSNSLCVMFFSHNVYVVAFPNVFHCDSKTIYNFYN